MNKCFINTNFDPNSDCVSTYNDVLKKVANNQNELKFENRYIFPEVIDSNKQNFPKNANLTYISKDGIQFSSTIVKSSDSNFTSILYKRNHPKDFWKKVYEIEGAYIRMISCCSNEDDQEKGKCMFILLYDGKNYLTRISNDYGVTFNNIKIDNDPTNSPTYGKSSYNVKDNLVFRIDLNDNNNINFYEYNILTNKIEKNYIIDLSQTVLNNRFPNGYNILSFDASLDNNNNHSVIIGFCDSTIDPGQSQYTCAYYGFDINNTNNKLENIIENIIPNSQTQTKIYFCQNIFDKFPLNFLHKISNDGDLIISSKLVEITDPHIPPGQNSLTLTAISKNVPENQIDFFDGINSLSIYLLYIYSTIIIDNKTIYFNTFHNIDSYFTNPSDKIYVIPPNIPGYNIKIIINNSFYVCNNEILFYDFIKVDSIDYVNASLNITLKIQDEEDNCKNLEFSSSKVYYKNFQLSKKRIFKFLSDSQNIYNDVLVDLSNGINSLFLNFDSVNYYLQNRNGTIRFYTDGSFTIYNNSNKKVIFHSYLYDQKNNFKHKEYKYIDLSKLNFSYENNFLFFKDKNTHNLIVIINIYDTRAFGDYCQQNPQSCQSSYLNYCQSIKKYSNSTDYPKYYKDTDPRCTCIDKTGYIEANFNNLNNMQKSKIESILPCISKECQDIISGTSDSDAGTLPIQYRDKTCVGQETNICAITIDAAGNAKINSEAMNFVQKCGGIPIVTDCIKDSSICPKGQHCDLGKKQCVPNDPSGSSTDGPITPPNKKNILLIIIIILAVLVVIGLILFFVFRNKVGGKKKIRK